MKLLADKTKRAALAGCAAIALATPAMAFADDVGSAVIVDTETVSEGVVTGTVGPSDENRVIIVNAAEDVSPTNFVINNAPFILTCALVIGGATFVVITNKRRAERRGE